MLSTALMLAVPGIFAHAVFSAMPGVRRGGFYLWWGRR